MAINIENVITIDSSSDLEIYNNEKSFRVFAGPGAGKTYLLINNIKQIIQNSAKLKKDGRQILCITYTNAAADEIKKRLGNFNKYVYVSTIHSFLYDMVIKQNMKQLLFQFKKQFDIELEKSIKLKPRLEGMNLLSMTKKEDMIDWLKDKISEDKLNSISKTRLASFVLDISDLNTFPFDIEKEVNIKTINGYSNNEAKLIKTAILEVANELDFDEILYMGYLLIREYSHIGYLLKYKFPYVLVDEYQDTNPIQNQTIKLFANDKDVVWGVVGDLIQSIYSFQGSTYQEFEEFSTDFQFMDYKIDGNRRSTKDIVNFCSYFRQEDPLIPLQTCVKNLNYNKKVQIILHSSNKQPNEVVMQDEDTVILCRSAVESFSFIDIEINQKNALKKIADTYQFALGRDMINTIQQGREEWLVFADFLVNIKESKEVGSLGKALLICDRILDTNKIKKSSDIQKDSYKKFLGFINKFNSITDEMKFLDIKNKVNSWLIETELLRDSEFQFTIPSDSSDDLYFDGIHNNVNILTYSTLKKMIKDIYTEDSKIMTIHRAKGLEFKKVIVGIEPFSRNERYINKLDVLSSPNVLPKEEDENTKKSEIAEHTRIIYVGISRAINELTLYIKINESDKEEFKNKFDTSLKNFMNKNHISEPFYEFIER